MLTMSPSQQTAKNISRWNTKKTELHVPEEPAKVGGLKLSEANAAIGPPRTDAQPVIPASNPFLKTLTYSQTCLNSQIKSSIGSPSTSAPVQTDEFDYTDLSTLATIGKVACLLCQRQFKTEEVLRKHVAQSDLHKARNVSRLYPELASSSWVRGLTEYELTMIFTTKTAPCNSHRHAYPTFITASMPNFLRQSDPAIPTITMPKPFLPPVVDCRLTCLMKPREPAAYRGRRLL